MGHVVGKDERAYLKMISNVRFVRYGLATAFLIFGIWNSGAFDNTVLISTKWMATTIAIYAVPLVAQVIPSTMIRVLALWFGAFLVLQTVATPVIIAQRDSFVTLTANLDYRTNFPDGVIPGIVGIQHVSTDEKGFRVSPRVDYAKKAGLRIFAIGASTTVDIYLDDHATWTHLLQESLREKLRRTVEVINTGVSGLRAYHHLATLKEISKYQPDIAIILVGVNDWNQAIRTAEVGQKTTLLPYFMNSVLGTIILDLYLAIVKRSTFTGGVFEEDGGFFNQNRNSLSLPDKREYFPDRVSPDYATELKDIAKECKNFEGVCVFLTQPHGYRPEATDEFKKSFWMTPPFQKYTLTFDSMAHIANLYNQHLIDFACHEGLRVFDLATHMEASFHSFHDDLHFNTEGAAKVARLVAQFMVEQVVRIEPPAHVPCEEALLRDP